MTTSETTPESTCSGVPAVSQPEIVKRAFTLPVVSDTYDTLYRLSSPLQPYMEKTVESLSPIVDSGYCTLKTRMEENLPESVSNGLASAKEQASSAIGSLDYKLCNGLDQLVDKVPALKDSTPELYATTKTAAAKYANLASTYLASFTVSQLMLKISESGLEAADGLLKMCPWDKWQPVVKGLNNLRKGLDEIRQEGAKINGTEKVKAIEEATLMAAVTDILGLHYIVSLFGGTAPGSGLDVATDQPDNKKTGKEDVKQE